MPVKVINVTMALSDQRQCAEIEVRKQFLAAMFDESPAKIWKNTENRPVYVPDLLLLNTAAKIKEIIQAGTGYAAQVAYTLVFLSLLYLLAEDHPRDVRQDDPWSNGWHMVALLIPFLTSHLIDRESEFPLDTSAEVMKSSARRDFYKVSVERNNYSRNSPGNSIRSELVKLGALITNGGTDQKAKHGHNVGSTAFRNSAQGGGGSGEERAIQDDWGSPDTATSTVSPHSATTTVNRSVQMTSPLPKTPPQTPPPPPPTPPPQTPPSPTPTPQVQLTQTPPTAPPQTNQSPTPTATPQVQPSTPTAILPPPPPPPPPAPPRAVRWFNFNFAGWFNFDLAGLAMIFIAISGTLIIGSPQILYSGGNSLSANDRTLLSHTKLFGIAGFILCFLGYIVRQDSIAAKLLMLSGCAANLFGLLLVVALGR